MRARLYTSGQVAAMLNLSTSHFCRSETQRKLEDAGMPPRDDVLRGFHKDAVDAWIAARAAGVARPIDGPDETLGQRADQLARAGA